MRRALILTRWGMEWERAARAFWPLATMLAVIFAFIWLNLVEEISPAALPWVAGLALIAVIVTAIRGGLRYRRVRRHEVIDRLDRTLPGRPLAALSDRAAIGGEGALWQAHLAQMAKAATAAKAVKPDAGLTRRDPFALRLAGLVALVMALIFGGISDMDRGLTAIAATATRPGGTDALPVGPSWEGWAEPPAYTRRPTIYLNSLPENEPLELPKGTALSFRLYDDATKVVQDIGPAADGTDPKAPAFRADETGVIKVGDRQFEVTVLPDNPPAIRAGAAPTRRADGRMVQDYQAEDDHGVMSAVATISIDLPAIDRRYGLAIDPEPRADLSLALPIPRRADRREIKGQLIQDLSRHPWANLPVKLTLRATDGIEQTGDAEPMQTVLPGRRFFQPLAAALIEIRRDLLWSRQNAGRSAEILRAVTWQPEGFVEQPLYLQLRGAVTILEGDELSDKIRDDMAEALWQAAIKLEDGGLSDALEKMRQAQQKLSEAIRNGASPDEIQRLMDELKEATDEYMRMLAEQQERDPAERFTRDQERQTITGDQIQQMMDEIQRLMNEGRMAEAQELLEQFNRMMENLQIIQGGDGEGVPMPGEGGSMGRLADTLREQQRLSDQAFRDMQEQFGNGQMGQPSPNAGDLADQQRQLREELGQQRGLLPGQGSEGGDRAGQELDEAGRAMEDAEQALREGDMSGAMQRQADAIESMRESMRALGDMMRDQAEGQEGAGPEDPNGQRALDPNNRPGGNRSGNQQGQSNQPLRQDPLGRDSGSDGNVMGGGDGLGPDGEMDPARRARDLLDEIRRRSAQRDRAEDERDYLGRLLDRF